MFYEIVIAPSYTEEGLATLKGKSKNLRILEAAPRESGARALRQVSSTQRDLNSGQVGALSTLYSFTH